MAEPVRVGDLLAAWPQVAGPAAARTRAEEIEDGVLRVAVESSGWLHRLTLEEGALLARCRAVVPGATLRAIRFRLASLAPRAEGQD